MAIFIASVFILMGKLVIVLGNCYFFLFIVPYTLNEETTAPETTGAAGEGEKISYTGPLLCVALGTYVTAEVTLGMFDESVLALMTCRAVDIDINGGREEDTKYGPPTFYDRFDSLAKKIAKDGKDGKYVRAEGDFEKDDGRNAIN